MALIEKTFYGIKCDACGKMLPNEWGGDAYHEEAILTANIAHESGWLLTDDGHQYCEDCISLNDDDCWETKDGKVYSQQGEPKE